MPRKKTTTKKKVKRTYNRVRKRKYKPYYDDDVLPEEHEFFGEETDSLL